VGASNAIPEDESLAAFSDRFLTRAFLQPVPDPQLEALLEGGWALAQAGEPRTATLGDLDAVSSAAKASDLNAVRPHLANALRTLRQAGISMSDRRAVKAQRLVAAAAALAGRAVPTRADLWPLVFAVPTAEGQKVAREALRELLAESENGALSAAAAEASLGPIARAARIATAGREVLGARPAGEDVAALAAWCLKLEGVAREIDAGFTPGALPPDLKDLRARIVEAVRPEAVRPEAVRPRA
jgi:MoxR-like ATPase